MVWMTAAEALDVLNVRPQTLYANVSRGKIRAKADGDDPRRSLYHGDDVLRMARRTNGRRKVEIVSSEAMQYGEPVLASSISTACNGKLLYRGHDAAKLADSASLEAIAALLWECDAAQSAALWSYIAGAGDEARSAADCAPVGGDARSASDCARPSDEAPGSALAAGLLALARRSAVDPPSLGRTPEDLRTEAASLLDALANAMMASRDADTAGVAPASSSINVRLARAWRAEAHEDLIRRALVLMADNELNASTFATRVAISTGASLAAGVLAGFTTLTGPLHDGAAAEFAQLIALANASSADDAVRHWLASARPLPAFGHPPQEAPFVLFAVGRCVGWLAHALEQVQAQRLIRPRARYTGPAEILNAGIY